MTLHPVAGAVVAGAGNVALLATFWDDAWHTDLGRDSAWIGPHLLLYGSMAVIGLVLAGWGIRVLTSDRSLRSVIHNRPLVVAGVGGTATLAAAPGDAWWHAAFGRDAVLWSPPHMLVVFASAALVTGVLAGLPANAPRMVTASLSGLLLGDLGVAVMEYDTDVPQFAGALYLPVLLAAGLLACWLVRRLLPGAWSATGMVLACVAMRLTIAMVLPALGRDTVPVLPIAVLGFALADIDLRPAALRYGAAAAAVSALAWLASVAGLATEPAEDVALVAIPVLAVFGVSFAANRRAGRRTLVTTTAVLCLGLPVLWSARPAVAHDAGEGPAVRPVVLTGSSNGDGRLKLTAKVLGGDCHGLTPRDTSARRAGQTVIAPLIRTKDCRFTGQLSVPTGNRWFVYVDLTDREGDLQTWLAVQANDSGQVKAVRELYRPAGAGAHGRGQLGAGVALYAVGFGLLAVACWLAARTARDRPGNEAE